MLRDLAQRAVKLTAATTDLVTNTDGIVVLAYHRVGRRTEVEIDLPAGRFAAQMDAIADRAVSLDTALDMLVGGTPLPVPRPIVLTFDDGTVDFAEVALPVLVERHIPALVYVATAYVDEQRTFPDDGRPISWSALADAEATGIVTVGSHTHSHVLLDRVDPRDAAQELDRSIDLIGDHIGTRPEHFAYPKALEATGVVAGEVRRRFRSAALAGTRPNRPGATDAYRLARSPIQHADGMRWFDRKVAGGMRLEDDLRRLANRRRYAGATN